MKSTFQKSVLAALIVLGVSGLLPATGFAASSDYGFDVLAQPIKAGQGATIAVQITQTATHKNVTNAAITGLTLHMLMGSMDMPVKVQALPQDDKGNYRFVADLTMVGAWTLDLVAAIPGEKEPVKATLTVQVVK